MIDWKFWMFIMQGITALITITGFIVIRCNDLHHLEKDVKEIKIKIDNIENRVIEVKERQIAQETICNERHSKK